MNATTPHLKRFAGAATTYRKGVSTSDMTLPAHASIFSGLYARRHGAHFSRPENPYGGSLSGDFETIAEVLSRAGYLTIAVSANCRYVTEGTGMAQGFQVFNSWGMLHEKHFLANAVHYLMEYFGPHELERRYRRAGEINEDVFSILEAAGAKNHPFFLFVNYMDAHTPYLPPPPFRDMFPGRDPAFGYRDYIALKEGVVARKRDVTEAEREAMISQYDGGIAYVDSEFERLLAWLRQMGLYNDNDGHRYFRPW